MYCEAGDERRVSPKRHSSHRCRSGRILVRRAAWQEQVACSARGRRAGRRNVRKGSLKRLSAKPFKQDYKLYCSVGQHLEAVNTITECGQYNIVCQPVWVGILVL